LSTVNLAQYRAVTHADLMIMNWRVRCIYRTASLVLGVIRRWISESRDGLSGLSWDAQTVWCSNSPHSWVLTTQTTRQHVRTK